MPCKAARALLLALFACACGDGAVLVLGDREPPPYRFGPPRRIEELSVPEKTDNPTLTADMLEIYFTSERGGGFADVYVAERAERSQPFGSVRRIDELSAPGVETSPAISADGLTLWFASDRAGGMGALDIWWSSRASRASAWSPPENLGVLNSDGNDIPRPPGQRARVMPMASDVDTPPFYRVRFAERADASSPFSASLPVPELAFPEESTVDGFLTDDGLTLFYVTGPAFGPADLYVATRRATGDPFEQPTLVEELSSPSDERDPWLSPDGRELYFSSDRSGHYDIYVASVERGGDG